ncbi:hypothetical protein HN937_29680 [Candidatus Poribacteria bacterium]|nr:hypothetical protein [Candidatus Poribacteria bacterium]
MHRFPSSCRLWTWALLLIVSPVVMAQQLSVDSPTALENDPFVTFTVTADAPVTGDVTVTVTSSDITATAGSDYAAVSDSVTILDATSSATYVVPLLDDAVVEGDETFAFTMSNPPAGVTFLNSTGTATIVEDDVVVPTLDVFGLSVPEGNDPGAPTIATVSVELSEATTVDVTFDVTTVDGTALVADNDYLAMTNVPYTIAAGETVVGIDITVSADTIAEPLEMFDVMIGNVAAANAVNTVATVTIENDDLLGVAISSDADADGNAESTVSPFVVNEYNDPTSLLTFDVIGGVGPNFTLTLVSTPALGTLHDSASGFELFAGDPLPIGEGGLLLEFVGTPQNSGSFEPADAFIITVTDDGDPALTSGSVIVELAITDVNQPVFVEREGLAFVASGSVANLPIVDFTDTDFDGNPNPSISDPDGDNLVFANPVSALGAVVSIAGSSIRYEAPIFNDPANASGPLTDTVTVDVSDDSGVAGTPVTADLSVKIQPVAEIAFDVSAGDGSFTRSVRLGVGPEGAVDTSATTVGSIRDMTVELSPPEAPGTSFRAWIVSDGAVLRDIQEINPSPEPRLWTIHVRTGGGGGSSIDWYGPDVETLVNQFDVYTGVPHIALIADIATGETWELPSDTWEAIPLADFQSYNFEVSFAPAAGATPVADDLIAGWNLVSVPGYGDLGPLDALSNSAFVWTGQYEGVGFLTQAEVPPVTSGVFINSNGGPYSLDVDVDSSSIRDVTAPLNPGWSLIGAPSNIDAGSDFPASHVTAQFGNQASVFGYDPVTRSYTLASELVAGRGYWVYNDTGSPVSVQLTQPRHLAADGSSRFHPRAAAPALSNLDWSLPVSLSDEDGALRTVQLGLSSDATAGYDRLDVAMPPPPPVRAYSHLYVGVDDAVGRLTRSVQAMDRSGTEWVMNARIDGASGLIEWQRPNVPEHWRLTMEAGGTRVDMAERQSVRLGAGTHALRVMLSWVAPTATRLMPNYPNPFNPETWIPFELTQAADVTVRVYGPDGAVVRTLALGYRAEGYYTSIGDAAYWDGRNESGEAVASGVYLYELRAGDYRAMRRMVILK